MYEDNTCMLYLHWFAGIEHSVYFLSPQSSSIFIAFFTLAVTWALFDVLNASNV